MSRDIALIALTWATTWALALTDRQSAYPLNLIAQTLSIPAFYLLIGVLFGVIAL